MKKIGCFLLLSGAITLCISPARSADKPLSTMLNINRVAAWYSSNGEQERRPIDGNSGLTYPRGTATAVYSAGLMFGGKYQDGLDPVIRVNGNSYNNGLKVGAILGLRTGQAEDPAADDVRIWRVRKDYAPADLRRDAAELYYTDTANVSIEQIDTVRMQYEKDWAEWPAHKGAPFYDANGDGLYTPQFTGDTVNGVRVPVLFPLADEPGRSGADQILWFVANDIGVAQPWECPESGMELQTTVLGYDRAGPLGDAVFKFHRLIYKGTSTTPAGAVIEDMYACQWSDPDMGGAGDDFAGSDSTLNMAYVYNAHESDADYELFGLTPPALGYDLLQGPLVAGKAGEDRNRNGVDDAVDFGVLNRRPLGPGYINLPMTSSVYLAAGGGYYDPPFAQAGAVQWYQMLRGLPPTPQGPPDPPAIIDPVSSLPSVYWLSGDPVSGQGWIDGIIDSPGDRRMLMSSGPFTMALGDTQEVVTAWIGGLGTSHLNSIEVMRSNDVYIQDYFNNVIVTNVDGPPEQVPVVPALFQNYPNPFNPTTTITFQISSRSFVHLQVFDILGREVASLISEELPAGVHSRMWDASGKPSGVYFYRLEAGGFTGTRRTILMR